VRYACNKNDDILVHAIADCKTLYWDSEAEYQNPPKCKPILVNEESITDSVFTMSKNNYKLVLIHESVKEVAHHLRK